jgi:hypothetical protein
MLVVWELIALITSVTVPLITTSPLVENGITIFGVIKIVPPVVSIISIAFPVTPSRQNPPVITSGSLGDETFFILKL